jgi:ABC-type transport system substrate-binding protein
MILSSLAGCSSNKQAVTSDGAGTVTQTPEDAAPTEALVKGGEDLSNTEGSVEPTGIQAGTTFKYWTLQDVPVYLPWTDNRATWLALNLYDNLLVKYKGDVEDIRCNIAESYTVSEDGMTWNFIIKKDVYFTNGNQVTAKDFIATWEVLKTYQARALANVMSYEAKGDFELVVQLNAPSATFIYELPTQSIYGVVDHTAIEQYGPEDNRAAVGCGPYTVESYTSGEGYILKANPNYHNPDRAPHIETCEIVIIPDVNTAMLALENGEIDCLNTVNIEVYNALKEAGWNIHIVEDRVNPWWLNVRQVPLFKDKVVREALCHMIDWQAVTDMVYDGMYPAAKSYWGNGAGSYPYSDKYTYNPELGIKMLTDAGYALTDMDFTILADPDFTDMEVAVVSQLNELGLVNVDTVTYDGATCYGMLKSGTYEVFPCHNGYGIESPLTPFTMGMLESGTQPVMFLKEADPTAFEEAMVLYNKANEAPTRDVYLDNVSQLTNLIQEECLALGGLQVMRMYAIADKFKGVYISPISGYIEFNHLWSTEG